MMLTGSEALSFWFSSYSSSEKKKRLNISVPVNSNQKGTHQAYQWVNEARKQNLNVL